MKKPSLHGFDTTTSRQHGEARLLDSRALPQVVASFYWLTSSHFFVLGMYDNHR